MASSEELKSNKILEFFLNFNVQKSNLSVKLVNSWKEHSHDFNDFRGFIERRAPGTIVHYADVVI